MSTISKLYRKDIAHEEVNTVGLFLNDQWQYQKEEITISQFNNLANHAVVIGNGKTCNEFDLTKILPSRATTRWGEIGPWVDKRQRRNFFTYGCNALYRNYKPDFLIATGDGIVKEIAESRADKSNVVYTYSKNLEKYSKVSFILIAAGALGNSLDFLLYGQVIDFIHVRFLDSTFPLFNLADSYISLGALFYLFSVNNSKKVLATNSLSIPPLMATYRLL